MDRAAMALHYHLFAAAPLVILAELGEANGVDLYGENHGALRKLVLTAASGLIDPMLFANAAGVAQNPQEGGSEATIAWARPFARRFPNPLFDQLLANAPRGYWMYGGMPPP